ncbi:hypothetical protein LEN26_001713 [Aphanomyces euteiches]|nr:hypothetical protein AeMF1_005893 [Aphanomyces euteiches]KAH9160778.1 hypothetical protein LEN26_001713 [Aphanomyces euteiches]KAH9187584.1 hypothetical protein AeNC1_010441 [Aphanomyces euteiches]
MLGGGAVEKSGLVRPCGIKTSRDRTLSATPVTPRRFKKFTINHTWLPLKSSNTHFDCLFPENHSSDVKKIKFATYPYHWWGLALMLAAGASVFVFALTSTSNFKIPKGFWWQYLIIVVMYLSAFIMFFWSHVEVFRLDMHHISVATPKTYQYIFCMRRKFDIQRKLIEVASILVEESGERVGEVDTRLYAIRFEFKDGTHTTLLECYLKRVALRRCKSLNFLLAAYTPASPVKSPKH